MSSTAVHQRTSIYKYITIYEYTTVGTMSDGWLQLCNLVPTKMCHDNEYLVGRNVILMPIRSSIEFKADYCKMPTNTPKNLILKANCGSKSKP